MSDLDKTLEERGNRYGSFEDNARVSRMLLDVALEADKGKLSVVHIEGLDYIFKKIARIVNGDPNYDDSWHDIAGFATLVENWINKDES